MSISKETVDYVANLARIQLNEQELERLSRQLQGILDFIDKLREIDISDIAPTSHILEIKNILRDDTPGESLPAEKALANAPSKNGRFFTVPKVIE
ncbi:MAG: Asp-tRNA(Asn)/Glu-tRNA(Gln) amidotransferase subunit GatC [Candidatus Omnitrophica bacterium]|nr:Asp-tRNA(Asn)/Glu-tRNA(Gln) amidotransferase subunit GatC [Candidatus Omnitrophota bacterium]MBU1869673.1 Asp-tRNA(Asn)/Glu-tRNA(Gln) amidotransferase subunit GatC [Candidatus Omnitrophota bacterium]